MADLKSLFFRVRENGAAVYRVDAENRQRRLDMQQIAVVNIRSGDVKPHGDQVPTAAERNEIDAWVVERRKIVEERRIDDLLRTTDHLVVEKSSRVIPLDYSSLSLVQEEDLEP